MANDDKEKAAKDEREQMEVGGSGTAKVAFKGATGDDVPVTSTTWTSVGPVSVSPDPDEVTQANLFAAGPGPATITCVGQTDAGPHTATVEIMVVDKTAPTEGTITLSLQPAPAKEKPKPAAPAQQPKPEHQAHHSGNAHRG